jgi:hypothetical protein
LKKLLLVSLLGIGSTFVASASPILCNSLANNFAALVAAGACTTQNVLFTFNAGSYNPMATGVAPVDVTATLTSLNFAGMIQVGWSFGPNSQTTGGAWLSAMTIGFGVRLCTAADVGVNCVASSVPGSSFTFAKAQEFAANGSPNPAMTNDFIGNSSTLHLPTDNSSGPANTNQGFFASGNTSVNPVQSTSTDGGALITIQDLITETVVPEPATMFLIGGALLVAGLNIKKFRRR